MHYTVPYQRFLAVYEAAMKTMFPQLMSRRQRADRMSMFFFRLHNLRREEENKKKQRDAQRQRQRRGAKVFRGANDYDAHLTLAPSRLFERTPMNPSDSLDEIALQIPR